MVKATKPAGGITMFGVAPRIVLEAISLGVMVQVHPPPLFYCHGIRMREFILVCLVALIAVLLTFAARPVTISLVNLDQQIFELRIKVINWNNARK